MKPALFLLLSMTLVGGDAHTHLILTLRSPDEQEGGSFGTSVAGVGDVSGDGVADVVVGAPMEDIDGSLVDAGRAYVFCGATGQLLRVLASPNAMSGGLFADCVAGVGDVDGDGCGDIAAGAFRESAGSSPAYSGRAYLFSGATGQVLHEFSSPNEQFEGHFGLAVAGAGDVDGDGVSDLVVGADYESPGASPHGAGRAYVFSGGSGTLLHTLVSPDEQTDGEFGWRVSGAGDVDRDGHADLLVGAHREDATPDLINSGCAYVFEGLTGEARYRLVSPRAEAFGFFGQSVAGGGDVDGDGFGDVIVGALLESVDGLTGAGRAYVFSGHSGALIAELTPPSPQSNGRFGCPAVGWMGPDAGIPAMICIGATNEDVAGCTDAGCAFILAGHSGEHVSTLLSPAPAQNGHFGGAVAWLGDVNGDGSTDVGIGAPDESSQAGLPGAGRAYVVGSRLLLAGQVVQGALELRWAPWNGAVEFWVYGAENALYFEPGLLPPFPHRIEILPSETTTWSSSAGISDSAVTMTYLVAAVDGEERMLARSNRVGEYEFWLGSNGGREEAVDDLSPHTRRP